MFQPSCPQPVVDCTARSEEEAVQGKEQCSPGRDVHPACPLPPAEVRAKWVRLSVYGGKYAEIRILAIRPRWLAKSSCSLKALLCLGALATRLSLVVEARAFFL